MSSRRATPAQDETLALRCAGRFSITRRPVDTSTDSITATRARGEIISRSCRWKIDPRPYGWARPLILRAESESPLGSSKQRGCFCNYICAWLETCKKMLRSHSTSLDTITNGAARVSEPFVASWVGTLIQSNWIPCSRGNAVVQLCNHI